MEENKHTWEVTITDKNGSKTYAATDTFTSILMRIRQYLINHKSNEYVKENPKVDNEAPKG